MVGSVNNGFTTQIPGATNFKPGQTSNPTGNQDNPATTVNTQQNASSTIEQNPAVNNSIIQDTTESQNSRPLSRENTNPLPSQDLLSASPRGSQLDISV